MSFKVEARCINVNPQANIWVKEESLVTDTKWYPNLQICVLDCSNHYHWHPESKSGNHWTFSRSPVISTDWRPPQTSKKVEQITEVLGSIKSMARLVPIGQFNSLFKGSNNKSTCQVNLDYHCHDYKRGRPVKDRILSWIGFGIVLLDLE